MNDPSKPALRAELRAARDGFLLDLPPGHRDRLETRASENLATLLDGVGCVAFYWALGSELSCAPAIAAAVNRGIIIVLPHVASRESAMRFLAWAPGDPLEEGWRGLIQPAAGAPEARPEVVVTPLLGFDSGLARLGQGAGFYDAAFAAHPNVRKIGFGWSIQQRPAMACDPWDVRLDAVVTELGVVGKGTA